MLKNYQSIHVKMAPTGKSIASIDLEKIKKSIFLNLLKIGLKTLNEHSNFQNFKAKNKSQKNLFIFIFC